MNKRAVRSLYQTLRIIKDSGNMDVTIEINGDNMLIQGTDIKMVYKFMTKIPITNSNQSNKSMDQQLIINVDNLISALGKLKEFDSIIIKATNDIYLDIIGEMDNEDIKLYAKIPIIRKIESVNEFIPGDKTELSVDSSLQNDNEIWI